MAEVLIDGYNLIRQTEWLWAQERRGGLAVGREALLRHLADYRRATGDAVTVVFDGDDGFEGMSESHRRMGVSVVFSRPPRSADDVIISRLKRNHGKKALRVVSSDRAIVNAAKRHKIGAVSSEAFAGEMHRRIATGAPMTAHRARPDSLSAEDVAYWEAVFGQETGLFDEEDAGEEGV